MVCVLGRLVWFVNCSFPHEMCQKLGGAKQSGASQYCTHTNPVSAYIYSHTCEHMETRGKWVLFPVSKRIVIPVFPRSKHEFFWYSCLIPAATMEKWKRTRLRTTFDFSLIHAVINAIFSGYKMMVLLTYSYICWSESLLLIHCCLSCGIWWTEVCIFLQPCGITQGRNILVKNISEINLLCESRILHITDCMAWHIFLWKANVLKVNSAEIIIQKSGMISSKNHRKFCIYIFVQVYLLNMHMAMPCPRTQ